MREIKFRAYNRDWNMTLPVDEIKFENGEAVSVSVTIKASDYDHKGEWADYIVGDEITIEQFTGLKDKNGFTDIYEDDIINSEGLVIGNKYQNYELLKESTNFLIQGFGTEDWETTNKKAMERGCKYSKRYADKNEF